MCQTFLPDFKKTSLIYKLFQVVLHRHRRKEGKGELIDRAIDRERGGLVKEIMEREGETGV